jgi:hypothetical protein
MNAKNVRVTSFSSVDIKERIFSADLEILTHLLTKL